MKQKQQTAEMNTSERALFLQKLWAFRWLLFVLAALFFAVPFLGRISAGAPVLPGEPIYGLLLEAESKGAAAQTQPFLVLLRLVSYDLLPYIFGSVGIGLLALFYLGMKQKGIAKEMRTTTLLFLLLMPGYLSLVFLFPHYGLLFLLLLLAGAAYFFHRLGFVVSAILLFFVPFFDLFNGIVAASMLFIWWWVAKEKKAFFIGALVLFSLLLNWLILERAFSMGPQLLENGWAEFFSDFGGRKGIGFFSAVLAVIGLATFWKEQKKLFFILSGSALAFLLLFIFYRSEVFFYLMFMLAYLGAQGFFYFLKRRWSAASLRDLTLFILLLGTVFSALTFLGRIAEMSPTKAMADSFAFLADESITGEVVLTYPQYGFWIAYFTKRPVVSDMQDIHNKKWLLDELFYSRDFRKTIPLFEEYGIRYVWIEPGMRKGLVWSKKDEGLLFVFKNEQFKKIYSEQGIEVWERD